MAVPRSLNKNNSAVKRIMQEARELANDPCTDYAAAPLEDNIFEWHCTLRGPQGTDFEGGLYHFRILLPAEYPFRPPSILLLTPNGRFELNTKICISFTNYHEESWQPAWGVRTAIIGLQGFFPLTGQAALGVGSLETSASERRRLAALSRNWVCPHCKQSMLEILPDPPTHAPAATPSSQPPVGTQSEGTHTHSGTPASAAALAPPPTTAPAQLTVTSDRAASEVPEPSASRRLAEADSDSTRATHGSATPSPAVTPSADAARTPGAVAGQGQVAHQASSSRRPQRPPLLLDGVIGVLLVLVGALLAKRIM